GRLEVTLEGTSTIPAGEEVEIDVRRRSPITRREEAETFVVEPPETLIVEGLPAGRYRVVARSPLAFGRTEATVPSGGTGRANVRLSGPAQVRIRLAWSDGEPMQASEVHLVRRDPSGSPLDLEQTARDVDGGVQVSVEAPAGPGSFSLDGNVLPVDLEPGVNTDLDWTLERSRRVVLSIQ